MKVLHDYEMMQRMSKRTEEEKDGGGEALFAVSSGIVECPLDFLLSSNIDLKSSRQKVKIKNICEGLVKHVFSGIYKNKKNQF